MALTLKNPHSVMAALVSRPQDVVEVRIPAAGVSEAWQQVRELAQQKRVNVRTVSGGPAGQNAGGRRDPRDQRGGGAGAKDGRTALSEALVKDREPVALEELLANVDPNQGLWLAFDGLLDPHNVGAIFRTAAFFGVKGIMMTRDRAATLGPVVYDTACGGVENVPFCIETNLNRCLEKAKEAGLWILGTSEHAKARYDQVARDRAWLLVLGNEESGMRKQVEKNCDEICAIPPASADAGEVTSLNVSVAAGILISRFAPP
ncbi:MAG: 23S rRNA (guanosine(2251)-2'-O)-methyltransferase RlmB [Bacteriovoracia bacterium]